MCVFALQGVFWLFLLTRVVGVAVPPEHPTHQFTDVLVKVVGNDQGFSQLTARLVAHLLDVCEFADWDGVGSRHSAVGAAQAAVVENVWYDANDMSITHGSPHLPSTAMLVVLAIRDETPADHHNLNAAYFAAHVDVTNMSTTFVWSYETMFWLRDVYLMRLCHFVVAIVDASQCSTKVDSAVLPLHNQNREYLNLTGNQLDFLLNDEILTTTSVWLNFVSTSTTMRGANISSSINNKKKGLCGFKEVFVVTGPESSGSEFAAMLVAEVKGITAIDTNGKPWKGVGRVNRGQEVAVLHRSQPNDGKGVAFHSRLEFQSEFPHCKIKYIVCTRDWHIARLSAIRRFNHINKTIPTHVAGVLRDIVQHEEVFLLPYEVVSVLGSNNFFARLYQFLGGVNAPFKNLSHNFHDGNIIYFAVQSNNTSHE